MLTKAQQQALDWLREHNATGVFGNDGVLIAGGERAPIMRSTWNILRDAGLLTIIKKRITLTKEGINYATCKN